MTSLSHTELLTAARHPTNDRWEARLAKQTRLLRWAALDLAFWGAVTLLFAGQNWLFSGLDGKPVAFDQLVGDQLQMWAPCALLAPAVAWVALRARFADGHRGRAAAAHVVAALAFAAAGGAAMGVLAWAMPGPEPRLRLLTAIWQGALGGSTGYLLVYGLIVAAVQAVAYGRESRERQIAAARLQSQLAEARVHALTAQLQPHFLFNTLNAVMALVRTDPSEAERTIGRLGDLLRYALANVDGSETTIREEVRFLDKYLEIQRARFGDRLGFAVHIEPGSHEARIPRLLIQPLVENAIRHGLAPRAAPGLVDVRVWRENGQLRLTVRDDGVGLPDTGIVADGVGLTATRARLRQAYGEAHTFALTQADQGGTLAAITIPFEIASGTAASG